MKKVLLAILSSCIMLMAAPVYAADIFDALEGLTSEQRQEMSNIYNSYKIKNNELLMQILSYTDKIANLKLNSNKTQEQISLIAGVYEKNIATLKNQQALLAKETEALYKLILNDKQYKQYQALQLKAQDAFSNFLNK